MTARQRLVFGGALVALMAASALLGWRANITFEPTQVRYIPVHFRYPLSWHVNAWTFAR